MNNGRIDGLAKLTGKAIFVDDIFLPGMLYCKLKRSPYAHAKIKSINIKKAKKLKGVIEILTGQDLPVKYGILPVTQDEAALAIEKVRYMGEPVAAVCAESQRIAEEALDLIEVEYEILPAVLNVSEAIKSNVRVHESEKFSGNAHKAVSLEFGDIETGFKKADYISENTFFYSGSNHFAMEPHSTITYLDEQNRLVVYCSTQVPHYVHRILAKVLQIPESQIRVIVPYVGGGFGGKLEPFPHDICCAKFTLVTGRPVKTTLSREETFYNHRGRHPAYLSVKTGIDKNGKITALYVKSYLDGGAYGSYGVATTYYQGAIETTTYTLAAYKFDAVRFYTNKPPCGAKRGHGTPQPRFALETHLNMVAEEIGISPVELRLKNLITPYSTTINHLKISSCALCECIEKVVKESDFNNKYKKLPYGEGIGFAISSYLCGAGLPLYYNNMPHSSVNITISRSGLVTIFSGHTEIGQGSDNAIAIIASKVLGIDINKVQVIHSDTDLTPIDLGSYSSRVTLMAGNATLQASSSLKEKIISALIEKYHLPDKNLKFKNNAIYDSNDKVIVTFDEAIKIAESKFGQLSASGSYSPNVQVKYKGGGVGPSPAYSYAACVCKVFVDIKTGRIVPQEIWYAHDIGKPIHKPSVEGQIEGSIYMALGEIFLEESKFSKEGLLFYNGALDYKTPLFSDMPKINIYLIESEEPNAPFSAKEVGQGPLLPIPPAIVHAVYDAIGIWLCELPLTPEKVEQALERKQKIVAPRNFPTFEFPTTQKIPPP